MKIIKIDTTNMNEEEIKKVIKEAIKNATDENMKKSKEKINDTNEAIIKEIAKQLEANEKILKDNNSNQLTSNQLTKLLKMFQEEGARLKNIFKIK